MIVTVALVAAVLLVAASFWARFTYRQPLKPRTKPGEGPAEARVMLLGTYRVYTWLIWLVVAASFLSLVSEKVTVTLPLWANAILLLGWGALLCLAHALYWRLGYDWRRWIFVAGHLTGVFCFAEYLWAFRRDIQAFLDPERRRAA